MTRRALSFSTCITSVAQIFRLFCRFPYFAADVLSCNAMIMEALLEGGWSNNDEESKDKSQDADDSSENSLVASILNKPSDDNQMVQSALNSQSVSSAIS